jgi:hypothetical protein
MRLSPWVLSRQNPLKGLSLWVVTRTLLKAYDPGLFKLYCIPRGLSRCFYCDKTYLRGLCEIYCNPQAITTGSTATRTILKAYHRCVCELSTFREAITMCFNVTRTLLKAYHRGLHELYCIPRGCNREFYCKKNPLNVLSPWAV